jgi:cell division protease FtsH
VAYEREQSVFLQPNMPIPQNRNYSEETANQIDIAVRVLVDQALERAINILQVNRALLDQTAEELLKTETLNQPEIIKLKQAIIAQQPNAQ